MRNGRLLVGWRPITLVSDGVPFRVLYSQSMMRRSERHLSTQPLIEVRGFKWPHRPTTVALARLLGEDAFGRWLGVARGDRWWAADGSHVGVFERALVKLVPTGTFWTACFHPVDPVVDVDIVLPVRWVEG